MSGHVWTSQQTMDLELLCNGLSKGDQFAFDGFIYTVVGYIGDQLITDKAPYTDEED